MKLVWFIGLITFGLVRSQFVPDCPPTGMVAIPYPGLCSQFIRCIFGNALIQSCAPGLAFDIDFGDCNAAGVANCNPCQGNQPGDVNFKRDELNCSRYTMCIGTVLSENQCGSELFFNPSINTCDQPANLDPALGCPLEAPTTTTTPIPPGGPDLGPPRDDAACHINALFDKVASASSCERYTICACGHPQVRNCPTGLIFDTATQLCNTPDQGFCLSESVSTCPPDVILQVAHPFDCRHLVTCIYGVAVLEPCAPGLEVNRRINKCDFPHIAQCRSRAALTYAELMAGMLYI